MNATAIRTRGHTKAQSNTNVDNIANGLVREPNTRGSGRGVGRFLYVTLSTGIGTGFLIDGDLYRGVNGSHPEMGHYTIDPSGPACYCGTRGCWESLASGTAIKNWCLEHDSSQRFSPESFSAETVFDLCKSGDPLAEEAVERLGRFVGLGLANLTMILVPEIVAIGGGLAMGSELFLDRARAIVLASCREVPAEKVVICTASLGQDVGLLGAAAVWLHSSR